MEEEILCKKRIRAKTIAAVFFLLFVFYVGSYILNSRAGGWMANESGKLRMMGMANCDQFIWMPRFGSCQRFRWYGGKDGLRADSLGYFYSPLILMDQAYFHPTIRFLNDDLSLVEPLSAPPLKEYHPTKMNRFARRFLYEAVDKKAENGDE